MWDTNQILDAERWEVLLHTHWCCWEEQRLLHTMEPTRSAENMTELKCIECNTLMMQVPVEFLEDNKFCTTEYLEMPVLIAIQYSKQNSTLIEVFLCPPPPHGEGCGAQTALVGETKEEEE
tara:strand:+ start:466 stop:828 length:363 start_codon:yes stop_codon:yes gene_type:complete